MIHSARAAKAAAVVLLVAACGSAPAASSPAAASPARTAVASVSASPSAVSTAAASPSATPSFEPLTGTLVFHRYDLDERTHVWTSCVDLTRERQLTDRPGYSAGWPTWSPDGSRIAFNANYADPEPGAIDDTAAWDIYTMDRDGGDVRQLTDATGLLGDPDWSRDGSLIAYTSDEAGEEGVWVMDAADGANARLVTPLPGDARLDYAARFSPDGTRLAFLREVGDAEAAIWVVNVDGTGLARITPPTLLPVKPDWAPDGSRIVFAAASPGDEMTLIWVVEPDGTGLTNLTPDPTTPGSTDGYSHPTWSPDGTWILSIHGVHPGPSRLGPAVMRPDGSDLHWLSDGPPGYEKLMDWSAAPC